MALDGKPSISDPRLRDSQDERAVQLAVRNIRERLRLLDAEVNALTTRLDALNAGGGVSAVNLGYQAQANRGVVTNSADSGFIIPVYSDTQAGLVPAGFSPGGGEPVVWTPFGAGVPAYWLQAVERGDFLTDTGTNVVAANNGTVGMVRARGLAPTANTAVGTLPALYQSTSTKRPTFVEGVFSGASALRFDGVNDELEFWARNNGTSGDTITGSGFSAIPIISSNQFTLIFAGLIRGAGAAASDFYNEDGVLGDTNGTFGMYVSSAGGGTINLRGGIFDTASRQVTLQTSIDTPIIWTLKYNNGVLKMRVDGGAWSSVAAGRVQSSNFALRLGRAYSATNRYSSIDVAHAVVYETAPLDDDLLRVERYLGRSIGVTID